MAKKISMRFQTPADSNGERTDIHPFTTTDEVIVNAESQTPTTLSEEMVDMMKFKITKTKPDKPCLWGRIIEKS